MRKFNLLLVDDHPIVSLGVETLLKEAREFIWLGAAASASTALESAQRLNPDIIVLDLILGGRDGLSLIAELLETAPKVRIIIYSSLEEKIYARRAFEAGASGYVTKEAGFMTLLSAIRSVAAGDPFAGEAVKQAMLREAIGQKIGDPPLGVATLSNQELCVLRLLGSGLGSAEVAAKLGVSAKTVGTYRERIKNKLGLHTARELERQAEAFFHTSFTRFEHGSRENAIGGHFK